VKRLFSLCSNTNPPSAHGYVAIINKQFTSSHERWPAKGSPHSCETAISAIHHANVSHIAYWDKDTEEKFVMQDIRRPKRPFAAGFLVRSIFYPIQGGSRKEWDLNSLRWRHCNHAIGFAIIDYKGARGRKGMKFESTFFGTNSPQSISPCRL
jgi:hypothetical protein